MICARMWKRVPWLKLFTAAWVVVVAAAAPTLVPCVAKVSLGKSCGCLLNFKMHSSVILTGLRHESFAEGPISQAPWVLRLVLVQCVGRLAVSAEFQMNVTRPSGLNRIPSKVCGLIPWQPAET